MALQDLTPQLRTRLSRMERAVGWFVLVAIGLLISGFVYYAYSTAARKGWFLTKATYFTFVHSATGLKIGDPVMMMGFAVGTITDIQPMAAEQFLYDVYVEFELKDPNYHYMWTEGSYARINAADFLGKRVLEVTRGTNGHSTYVFFPLRRVTLAEAANFPQRHNWVFGQETWDADAAHLLARPMAPIMDTNLAALRAAGLTEVSILNTNEKRKAMTGMWDFRAGRYDPYTNKVSKYWLQVDESPGVSERIEALMSQVQLSLPGVFSLTNQLSRVLTNVTDAASNLNAILVAASPAVSNIANATAHLDQPGSLGQWLLPTNLNTRLDRTLASAASAMDSANTNLAVLVANLARSLDNLASITSNLNQQVEANTNLVSGISQAITHADELVQGLKRHWLLRSAFRTNAPAARQPGTNSLLRSPKDRR